MWGTLLFWVFTAAIMGVIAKFLSFAFGDPIGQSDAFFHWATGISIAVAVLAALGGIWITKASSTIQPPSNISSATMTAVMTASASCDVATPDLDDPSAVRDALRVLSEDMAECAFSIVDHADVIDCVDMAGRPSGHHRFMVHHPWHLNPLKSPRELLEQSSGVFHDHCILQAALFTYDRLGADRPAQTALNYLYETWHELCGAGHRSSSSSGWWSRSASASATDSGLVHNLADLSGRTWDEALDAVLAGYETNGIRCTPARTVEARKPIG